MTEPQPDPEVVERPLAPTMARYLTLLVPFAIAVLVAVTMIDDLLHGEMRFIIGFAWGIGLASTLAAARERLWGIAKRPRVIR